jgi:HK97 gp10 family phage protein
MARPVVTMKLHGAKELEAALNELPKRLAKTTLRRALVKAAEPVKNDAAARAGAIRPGLAKSIALRPTLSRRQRKGRKKGPGEVEVFLGPSAARRGLAHLIEFGTGPRRQRTTGRYTGVMPARPFMRPAWEAGKHGIVDRLGKILWEEIKRAADRLAKRQAKKAGR